MRTIAKVLAVAAGHIAFLFFTYGYGLLSILPYDVWCFVWFIGSTATALALYYFILSNVGWVQRIASRPGRIGVCATLATFLALFSLYWGVFYSFNTFGT